MLTKEQEIELIDKTIERLPSSYLQDILRTERGAIEQAIRNDFGFIDVAGTITRLMDLRKDVHILEEKEKEAKRRTEALEERYRELQRQMRLAQQFGENMYRLSTEAIRIHTN